MEFIDENYGSYYPPRELAGYLPAYLSILFVFAPILYMGLNMAMACPNNLDNIDWIWDTIDLENDRKTALKFDGNGCISTFRNLDNNEGGREIDRVHQKNQGEDERLTHCNSNEKYSVPTIRDLDVRMVNLHVRRQLSRPE
mmetsp:Transcript_4682/g.9250  ORF Transcript_4682/g.9250 Transcript_4682/m.9250 type:complete len:141 (+) Transcript_4682:141-563(+)|eukprot:CAMPEP_0171344492 /NCGR_PEP_ID=MMETSP0878-20121228/19498_1 /TAXON_ID=67004 /ORGANISM="Thalassiosira weissflogii, Strain CCMP1336" /LENGTH=140 /DNA_ID=CAMNT_0011847695 /DNA_START=149 /DNA_END=571 /DNA_ORIENTATION=+